MAWSKPEFSKGQVDAAGRLLAESRKLRLDKVSEVQSALEIVGNWRSTHSFPMNTLQVNLRRAARRIDPSAIVTQRLKRMASIIQKLRRYSTMKLSRMQDIGGARAVVSSVPRVRQLREHYRKSGMKHIFVGEKDYIEQPKSSGYRGVHLIYKYKSDRSETYNGLQIELQIRSRLQHAWATAVETVGTFIGQSLKSSEGEEAWLEFFKVASTAFAIVEKTPLVPDTPVGRKDVVTALKIMWHRLDAERTLHAYGIALQQLEESGLNRARYFLLVLRPAEGTLDIKGYQSHELARANREYLDAERSVLETAGGQAVLVSAESLDSLRKAYPNYFLDTTVFVSELKAFMDKPTAG